jgi:Cu/Ag efflux protein CusF
MLIGAGLSPVAAHEGHNHNLPVVEGKVVKVDESAGTVTIKHSAIPNLQMEAMTMVFKASVSAKKSSSAAPKEAAHR